MHETLSTRPKSEFSPLLLSGENSAKTVPCLKVFVSINALHLSVGVKEIQDLELRSPGCELGHFGVAW